MARHMQPATSSVVLGTESLKRIYMEQLRALWGDNAAD
jgi:hypothetical protein